MTKRMSPNSLANLAAGRRTTKRPRYSYTMLGKITCRMMNGRFTLPMIARTFGISWASADRWATALHEAGCIHIVEYLRSANNRVTSKVYQWGAGDDAPKPKRMSPTELQRRHRRKRTTLDAWRMPRGEQI